MTAYLRITRTSRTVDALLSALTNVLAQRGLTVFAVFDHSAAATEVGMSLSAETVVVFGNPSAGTYLMQEDPQVGIELPLKILMWHDGETAVVGYRDPLALAESYNLARERPRLEQMSRLMDDLVSTITAPTHN